MDVAGSAVGIASLGIQICQGLLSYYGDWKGYDADISSAYHSIHDLSRTLISLEVSLNSDDLDEEKKDWVKRCLHSCAKSLAKLSQKSQKLRQHGQPESHRQNALTELQRAWYPFRASTLGKLREIVADVRERLKLAVQVLQLDVSATSQRRLKSVAADTNNIVDRTATIATSVAHVSAQNPQILDLQQSDQFKKIIDWLSPPDPWTNHAAARQRHEPRTGTWLLQSDHYERWKTGDIRHLWLYGKAGCGKTVLCSTVIEDIRMYCDSRRDAMYAIFYFTFSDNQKQSYEGLLCSLVAQLGWKEPGLSMLVQAYEKPNASTPGAEDLERILLACIRSYDELFLLLDALDECPEGSEVRQNVLQGLERLAQEAPNIRMFMTSREVTDVRESMRTLGTDVSSVHAQSVDVDIQRYISNQLSRDRKLSKLDATAKKLIGDTISRRADGMFRWAYCQLQELKKLKSTKPKYVKEALLALPATLDETYERMLIRIDPMFRKEATVLLQWLAYAQSPPTLDELAEASIIDLAGEGSVDVDNRGSFQDTLEILGGLVTCSNANDDDGDIVDYGAYYEGVRDRKSEEVEDSESERSASNNLYITWPGHKIGRASRVRLAHFSVKEYLESKRIIQSSAKDFFLERAKGHRFLAQSCLTYIMHYSSSDEKTSSAGDFRKFPLLRYAARSWYYHSSSQLSGDVRRETSLLQSEDAMRDWLLVHCPDIGWKTPFDDVENMGTGVYYASYAGLQTVVRELLAYGADVNVQGGEFGNALQAASLRDHDEVVSMLLEQGADVNAQGGDYGNALQAASWRGHEKVVKILLERDADINAQGGFYGNALQAASWGGHENVVSTLIERGAGVNAPGGEYGNALQAASRGGYTKVVSMLLERGANVNARGGEYGNALQAASWRGNDRVVSMLTERGADINAQGGFYGNALQAASWRGNDRVVSMLTERGADINAQGGFYGNALQAASQKGHAKVVKMLTERGVDINAQGGFYGNALQAASQKGHAKVVKMLIEAGADVNTQGGEYGNALQAASFGGHEEVVEMLLEQEADVNAQGGAYGNALQAASFKGHEEVVEMLIEVGADVNAQGGRFGNALQAASLGGHEKVVSMLLERGADVNAQGGEYSNALQAASWRGHEKLVSILLERRADVNAQGGDYGNALQAASWRGHAKVVEMLIERGLYVTAQGSEYSNALQAASQEGHAKVVEMLIERGANVNVDGGEYSNALQAASQKGHAKVVKMLIEAGADVNTQGGEYGNALQAASWRGHEKVVKMLLERDADINAQGGFYGNALQAASWGGHENVVSILIERGADVDAQGGEYSNALQAASQRGHKKVVQMLVGQREEVDMQDQQYSNALRAASEHGHENVVQWLIDAGADVNAAGGLYGNVLQGASLLGHDKVVRILIDAGADVNAKGGVYSNALRAASYEGHFDVVYILIEAGADINAQGGLYDNALQAACLEGHLKVVRILIERGADVNEGQSDKALHVACREGRLEIVELLLANGADINCITETGSALEAARERGHDRIIALLVESGAFETEVSHLEDLYDHNSDVTVEAILPLRVQDLEPDQLEKSEEKDSVASLETGIDSVSSHMQYSIVSGPTATTATSYTRDHKSIPAGSTTFNPLPNLQPPLQEVSGVGSNALPILPSDPTLDLEAVLNTGSLLAVHSLLETQFDTIATGPWTWLTELADLGYRRLEMAELLLEQHEQSPWIHFKPWVLEFKLPNPQFHISGCVHTDLDERHGLVQSNLANVNRPLVDTPTLRRTIASLCGLAGVLPNNPSQSEWNGAVDFSRISEATVRYNFDNADLAMLLDRVKKAVEGLCTAIATVQEGRGCCNRITALCMCSEQSTVELNSVHLRDVVRFFEALKVANVDKMQTLRACTQAARTILQCMHDPETRSTTAEIVAANNSDCLHICALAAQFLSLAVVGYSQAHCGPFDAFFLEQEVTGFNLLGISVNTNDRIYIRVATERLTCLDAMLNAPVMVFSLSTITQGTTGRLSVLANANDVLDTWGPGGITKSSKSNNTDVISSVNLRGGLIYAVGPKRCHWARYEDLNESWWVSDWSRSASILIGAHMSVNSACLPSEPRCLNVIQESWLPLGTNAPYWRVQGREASVQTGQYLSANFNTVWDKVPGTSLKEKLLDDLKHALEYSSFLNAPCGLRVSFCSGLATRVRMRDILAELMPIYVKRKLTAPHDWQKLINVYQVVEKLGMKDVGSCESMLQRMSANDLDCFQTFWTLASEIIITLKDTGLHPTGELFVVGLVPSVSSEPIRRIDFRAEGSNFWTKALQDTESCATFAYFTLACLQVSGRGCRNTEQRWHGQVLLLQTEVHRQFSWFSVRTPPNAWSLQGGESYLLGGKDVALCAKVIRSPPSADPQLLVKKSMMPHGIFKRYMQKQNRQQYLQEKMSPSDNAHHAFMTSSENAAFSFT